MMARFAAGLALAAVAAGCGDLAPLERYNPVDHVNVFTYPYYLQVADTLHLTAGVYDANGEQWSVERIRSAVWTTSNAASLSFEAPQTTTIFAFVVARALQPGRVLVSATLNGVTGSDSLFIIPRIGTMELLPAQSTIAVGDTVQLEPRILDLNGQPIPDVRPFWRVEGYTPALVATSTPNRFVGASPATVRVRIEVAKRDAYADVTITAP